MSEIQVQLVDGGRRYSLSVSVMDDRRPLEVVGADDNGQLVAEMRGELPAADLPLLLRLLSSGAAALAEVSAQPKVTLEQRRRKHENSHRPWSAEADEQLKALAGAPGTSIQGLMEALGRSRDGIRKRLSKVGIDPDALPYRAQS